MFGLSGAGHDTIILFFSPVKIGRAYTVCGMDTTLRQLISSWREMLEQSLAAACHIPGTRYELWYPALLCADVSQLLYCGRCFHVVLVGVEDPFMVLDVTYRRLDHLTRFTLYLTINSTVVFYFHVRGCWKRRRCLKFCTVQHIQIVNVSKLVYFMLEIELLVYSPSSGTRNTLYLKRNHWLAGHERVFFSAFCI